MLADGGGAFFGEAFAGGVLAVAEVLEDVEVRVGLVHLAFVGHGGWVVGFFYAVEGSAGVLALEFCNAALVEDKEGLGEDVGEHVGEDY